MRINLLGGPGSGKSTTAAWLFSELKTRNVSIELVTEYVKSWACQKREVTSFDQIYLLGKQMQYEYRFLNSGIKNIITDSPIFLSAIYADVYYKDLNIGKPIMEIVDVYEKEFPSLNIFLNRKNNPYNSEGRYQTYEEAQEIDKLITNKLNEKSNLNIQYIDYNDRIKILEKVLENIND